MKLLLQLSRSWSICLIWAAVLIARMAAAGEMSSEQARSPESANHATALSLSEAIERTLTTHPELRLYRSREASLKAAKETAAQRPPLSLAVDAENFGGTGATSAADSAEITLSLASVLERGGKREARQAVAAIQLDAVELARETTSLDLTAEVARRFLDVIRAQAQANLKAEEVAQRALTVAAATHRVQAGASPESTKLTAEAAQARAEIERKTAEREIVTAFRRLALLWGDRKAVVRPLSGNLVALPVIPDFENLAMLIEQTPELKRFATESRLREARLQLARSERSPDISWKLGVRRLQDLGDWAVVAGVSVPLGSARRAKPEIRSAEAELDALAVERQSSEQSLFATLAEAHGRYMDAYTEVNQFRDDLLPRLKRAEVSTERAYRAGALSYLEWAQVQSDTINARERQLALAHQAHLALIEIQRLTGEPFVQSNPDGLEPTP
jgi:cobalt-zinc-cadmium efflux system outer membrane protein